MDLFNRLCDAVNMNQLASFCMICWSLWRKRNIKVWEEALEEANVVLARACHTLQDWKKAKEAYSRETNSQHSQDLLVWRKPPLGFLKCNVDAGFHNDLNVTSMGCCIRDAQGHVVAAHTSWSVPTLRVKEGEALALLTSLQLAAQMQYNNFIFELDCKCVVEDISKATIDHTEYGSLYLNASHFLVLFPTLGLSLSGDKLIWLLIS